MSWFYSHLELSDYSQNFCTGKKLGVEFPHFPKPGGARAQGELWEPLCLFSDLSWCLKHPGWIWMKDFLLCLQKNQRQGEFPWAKEELDEILVDESLEKPLTLAGKHKSLTLATPKKPQRLCRKILVFLVPHVCDRQMWCGVSLDVGMERSASSRPRNNALKMFHFIQLSGLVKHLFHCEAELIS